MSIENLIKWYAYLWLAFNVEMRVSMCDACAMKGVYKRRHFNWLNGYCGWMQAANPIQSNSIQYTKRQANELNGNKPNVKTWPFSAIVTNNNCSHVRSIRKRANRVNGWYMCTHRLRTFCLLNDPVCCLVWHSMRSHNEMLNNKKTWCPTTTAPI